MGCLCCATAKAHGADETDRAVLPKPLPKPLVDEDGDEDDGNDRGSTRTNAGLEQAHAETQVGGEGRVCQDLSPVQVQRLWLLQAETNVRQSLCDVSVATPTPLAAKASPSQTVDVMVAMADAVAICAIDRAIEQLVALAERAAADEWLTVKVSAPAEAFSAELQAAADAEVHAAMPPPPPSASVEPGAFAPHTEGAPPLTVPAEPSPAMPAPAQASAPAPAFFVSHSEGAPPRPFVTHADEERHLPPHAAASLIAAASPAAAAVASASLTMVLANAEAEATESAGEGEEEEEEEEEEEAGGGGVGAGEEEADSV